jgi:two-component system, OmpR family, response regulator MtrA
METTSARILLIEDDRYLRKSAEASLRRRGFTVFTAGDGEEGVRIAREACPHLVLLDLIMPKLQGFEVLRMLKEDPVTAGIPVLVLSNLGQASDIAQAREAGAVGYLVKADITLAALGAAIDEILAGTPA